MWPTHETNAVDWMYKLIHFRTLERDQLFEKPHISQPLWCCVCLPSNLGVWWYFFNLIQTFLSYLSSVPSHRYLMPAGNSSCRSVAFWMLINWNIQSWEMVGGFLECVFFCMLWHFSLYYVRHFDIITTFVLKGMCSHQAVEQSPAGAGFVFFLFRFNW